MIATISVRERERRGEGKGEKVRVRGKERSSQGSFRWEGRGVRHEPKLTRIFPCWMVEEKIMIES